MSAAATADSVRYRTYDVNSRRCVSSIWRIPEIRCFRIVPELYGGHDHTTAMTSPHSPQQHHLLAALPAEDYSRGHIKGPNRAQLEKRVCECYALLKKDYGRLPPYELSVRPNETRQALPARR